MANWRQTNGIVSRSLGANYSASGAARLRKTDRLRPVTPDRCGTSPMAPASRLRALMSHAARAGPRMPSLGT